MNFTLAWAGTFPPGESKGWTLTFWERESRYWMTAQAGLFAKRGLAMSYPFRKVWREGLEVAFKIKGSQGQRRVVWLKVEHPFTAISPTAEVHAHHNEAQNAAIR